MTKITDRPLLQQSEMGKQYVGISVSWKGMLCDADKIENDEISLHIRVMEDEGESSVFYSINPTEYPGIGLLRKGHEIMVEGKIKEIGANYIMLNAERVVFDIDEMD